MCLHVCVCVKASKWETRYLQSTSELEYTTAQLDDTRKLMAELKRDYKQATIRVGQLSGVCVCVCVCVSVCVCVCVCVYVCVCVCVSL